MREKKLMVGHKLRRLRKEHGLTQAQMAEEIAISTSYLNLIERNQRPVTVQVLLKLAQRFAIDLQSFAADEEAQAFAVLKEVFSDPLLGPQGVTTQELRDMAAVSPGGGHAVSVLYRAYREAVANAVELAERLADQDRVQSLETMHFPVEEVRDFIQSEANHFPVLETAAERLWQDAELESANLSQGLCRTLQEVHGVEVKIRPIELMRDSLRQFDPHSREIRLSEMLTAPSRNFQLAYQVALLSHDELLNGIVERAQFTGEETRRLCRVELANYFAAAVLMPYDRFLEAAKAVRYDIEILMHRFGASFEQTCHRLTTLQRLGARGVPFFLIRVDSAGNISKRFSAGGFHFARFGGTCARWIVHDAFSSPGKILRQIVQMPDGTTYFTIARTVRGQGLGHQLAQPQFTIGLGCEVSHAGDLVYADGYDLGQGMAVTPIGPNCRLCDRLDCNQRAFPPLNRRLHVDENHRRVSPFSFLEEGE